MSGSTTRRRLRGFMRWMEARGIQMSDGLQVVEGEGIGCGELGVMAAYDFKEGDAIASIPKDACLTLRTTGAAHALEEAQLSGGLGLVAALMYERSQAEASSWFSYLNLLPLRHEALPIVWEPSEIDALLLGTELHPVVKEDQRLMREDWQECIWPLTQVHPNDFPKEHFSLDQYLSAKTLVASRSFEVDDFHGFGMVPLADLFNHKTGGEDLHIMRDPDSDCVGGLKGFGAVFAEEEKDSPDYRVFPKMTRLESGSLLQSDSSSESSDGWSGSDVLELVLVKNVSRGSEIFNTYGELSNASLLHRHGFTEAENPYDIVNIDYTLVMEYCTSFFSKRHVRSRVRLWKKYGCNPCESQKSAYFEIMACGKPQPELLFLLYIVHLSENAFYAADVALHDFEAGRNYNCDLQWADKVFYTVMNFKPTSDHQKPRAKGVIKPLPVNQSSQEVGDLDGVFLTVEVCKGLLWLSDLRDKAYGQSSLQEDLKLVNAVNPVNQPKLFHALSLRVSERSILKKFRCFICEELERRGKLEVEGDRQ